MKKLMTLVLAITLALTVCVLAASAFEVTHDGTTYDVFSPKSISLTYQGTKCEAIPKGAGMTIDVLADGDLKKDATTFDTAGVVLIKNCYIEEQAKISMPVHQEEIPVFSLEMDMGENVTFDSAYVGVYHEVAVCIGTPGESKIIVEVSKDGKTWVPVGDGVYFLNTRSGGYIGEGDQGIDECVVKLSEKTTSRYVRYSFTFKEIPEGDHWRYYTDVHDWCAFTEIGVALYKSGKEQSVIDQSQIQAEPTKVEGLWKCEDGDNVLIYLFDENHGDRKVTIKVYDAEEFEAGNASPKETLEASYSVLADKLTITYADGGYDEYKAVVDDEGDLLLGDDLVCTPYIEPIPGTDSSESGDETTEEPDASSEEEPVSSEEPASSEPTAASSEEASTSEAASSAESSSEGEGSEGGLSTGAIVGIIIGVVAVIAIVVVVVIVSKKKKQ